MTDQTTRAKMEPSGGFRITTALEKLFGPDRTGAPAWSEPQKPRRPAATFTTIRREAPAKPNTPPRT